MRHFKLFLILLASLFAIACESEKTSSFLKGNPYAKDFAGLNGPVKYVVYSTFEKGIATQATRNDYSTEGVLVKSKTYEKGDSMVYHYIYDPSNNIQDISGTDITDYKNEYQKNTLVKEWVYHDKEKKNGITKRYQIKGETLIKKVNDIKTGAGTTYTYFYNSKGILMAKQTMVNDGSYWQYEYDPQEHLKYINYYTRKGKLRFKEKITCKYDNYGNCTRYVARRKGKVVETVKITYKYYTEDELKKAKLQVEGGLTNQSVIKCNGSFEPARPSDGLMTAIVITSILFFAFYLYYAQKRWGLFRNFGGTTEYNGMRKMWMYNAAPYIKMGTLLASVFASFLSAIIVLLLCGGVVWVFFWAINLMIWGIIILGWILMIGGIIATLFKHLYGIIAAILGGIIIYYSGTLTEWGEGIVDWGANLLDHLNAIDWTLLVIHTYGKTALLAIAIPLVAFLSLAILLIICCYVLRAIEFASIKIYNVNRPCPICGNKKHFIYMVNGKEYPIELHPGVYGIFHQTSHHTGAKVPTMLMNGKAKLTRKCSHCGQLLNTAHDRAYGTDIHIGIVGERSSGKSYMLYSGLELLMQKFGKEMIQIDVDNNQVEMMAQRIHHQDGIQTAVKNRYKAIQFRVERKWSPIPYQLYFYDVAGENFNVYATYSSSALEFYTNVKTVVFIIDPTMTDIDKVVPSEAFADWFKKHGNQSEMYDTEGTLAELKNILTQQVGRKTKDIDIIVTCTKKDLGYLENSNYTYDLDENMIQKFISEELGLGNVINSLSDFKSVSYAAVSATAEDKGALEELFLNILKQRGIKVKVD